MENNKRTATVFKTLNKEAQNINNSIKSLVKKQTLKIKKTARARSNLMNQFSKLNKKQFNRRSWKKAPENYNLAVPPSTPMKTVRKKISTAEKAEKAAAKELVRQEREAAKEIAKAAKNAASAAKANVVILTPPSTPNMQASASRQNKTMNRLSNVVKKLAKTAKRRLSSASNKTAKAPRKKLTTAEKTDRQVAKAEAKLEREYLRELAKIDKEITKEEKASRKAAKKEAAEAKKASKKVRRPSAATCALCQKMKNENVSQ